jgi:iron complex transport system substrate-binding protein
VGVTTFCRYPPEAQSKPKIGTFIEPDFERILAQRPDLVFVIRNPVDLAGRLRRLGLRVEELRLDTVDEILASIRQAGRAAGAAAAADALALRLRADLDRLRAASRARPPVSVLYIIDRTPGTLQGMFAAGPGSYLGELIAIAGGRNLAPAAGGAFPKLSLEQVLAADPEVLIDMGDYSHGRPSTPASRQAKLALWSAYPNLRAVRHRRVYDVSSDEFVVPGPRLAQAARALTEMLHGPAR